MISDSGINFQEFKKEVLEDYRIGHLSRNLSLLGRKEVLNGKAKFGFFGEGKEVAQIAMAKQFKNGDWRSGHHRDQTFMLAAGMATPLEFFASLYDETDIYLNPDNDGQSFNNHFGTRTISKSGEWLNLVDIKCTSPDISPTAGQMPRLVGLAFASKLYRNNSALKNTEKFSHKGNEVAFGSIGDTSTSEGHFFETIHAAALHQIPMAVSVWDDGYGISVPKSLQTAKNSISELLKGFEKGAKDKTGILIYKIKGWDYAGMCQAYQEGLTRCRKEHVPVLFHVDELTQPVGHSTSGLHERFKSAERLQWEKEFDCLLKMKEWMIERTIATADDCEDIEKETLIEAQEAQEKAWKQYKANLNTERDGLIELIEAKPCICAKNDEEQITELISDLKDVYALNREEILSTARKILRQRCNICQKEDNFKHRLQKWVVDYRAKTHVMSNDRLYAEDGFAALNVQVVPPRFADDPVKVTGREILRDNFDALFAKIPELVSLGQEKGVPGGVNKSMEGLQKKHGELCIWDEGIRETTILGIGLGLALRGFRPIAEIQYFDDLMYGLRAVGNDLATLRYRTKGGQKAPVIIRTRCHRLEGIWHSGSPTGMVVNSVRGVCVCVPRDMTQAAGMYNTLLQGDDPALVIEPLNGYIMREPKPENMGEFNVPLGIPEVLHEGLHVTLVTYGSCVSIAREALGQLSEIGISVELIDVQTLLPFDINGVILESLKKTNRVVFFDEDVPGGTTAFMMQQVLEKQGGFQYLDSSPRSITAKYHRPAFGAHGNCLSNPGAEDVYDTIYDMMNEFNPQKYPPIY